MERELSYAGHIKPAEKVPMAALPGSQPQGVVRPDTPLNVLPASEMMKLPTCLRVGI